MTAPGPQQPDEVSTWDYATHPGGCHPTRIDGVWTTCCAECAGTGVWPCPWIDSPAQGGPDESCVNCKASGRAVVGFAAPSAQPDCDCGHPNHGADGHDCAPFFPAQPVRDTEEGRR